MIKVRVHQTALFSSLAALAIVIMGISMVRESRSQVERGFGSADPSPITAIKLNLLEQVPKHSEYILPNPGILPNHPLYPLKMMGARLKLITTLSAEKKAALLLEYANIRIAAASALVRLGYTDRAVSTAAKGEIYLFQAVQASPSIPSSQKITWFNQLEEIVLKHEEVIEYIHILGDDETKNQTTRLSENLALLRNQVAELSGKPFSIKRPEEAVSAQQATPSAAIYEVSM